MRVLALDAQRQQHFLHLAGVGLVEREEALAGQLLGEGAAALRQAPFLEVGHHRSADADEVDAGVRAEALILDGQDGVDEVRRDVGQRHLETALLEDGERRGVGRIVEDGGLGHLAHLLDVADARQIDQQGVHGPLGAGDDAALRQQHDEGQRRPDGTVAAGQGPEPRRHATGRPTIEKGVESHVVSSGAGGAHPSRYYDYFPPKIENALALSDQGVRRSGKWRGRRDSNPRPPA